MQLGVKRKSDIYTTSWEGKFDKRGRGKRKERKRKRGNVLDFFGEELTIILVFLEQKKRSVLMTVNQMIFSFLEGICIFQ